MSEIHSACIHEIVVDLPAVGVEFTVNGPLKPLQCWAVLRTDNKIALFCSHMDAPVTTPYTFKLVRSAELFDSRMAVSRLLTFEISPNQFVHLVNVAKS